MEWYMGKYIRPLSDAVFTIASDDLWIESLAIQQLHTTANLPNMQRVVGMPDLHPGRGYPIGAAFFSVGRFYPALWIAFASLPVWSAAVRFYLQAGNRADLSDRSPSG